MDNGCTCGLCILLSVRKYDLVNEGSLAQSNCSFGSVQSQGNTDDQLWLPQSSDLPGGLKFGPETICFGFIGGSGKHVVHMYGDDGCVTVV